MDDIFELGKNLTVIGLITAPFTYGITLFLAAFGILLLLYSIVKKFLHSMSFTRRIIVLVILSEIVLLVMISGFGYKWVTEDYEAAGRFLVVASKYLVSVIFLVGISFLVGIMVENSGSSNGYRRANPNEILPNGFTRSDYHDYGISDTDIELWGMDQPNAPDPGIAGWVIADMADGNLDGHFDIFHN